MSFEAQEFQEMKAERWRVFCAVALPEEVRNRAAVHTKTLREAAPKVRASWPRAESLHVTLKFLGEMETARVNSLSQAAARAAEGFEKFELAIEGAGAFPPRGMPRVLWLGVRDESGKLSMLHKRLEEECAFEGFARETRAFHPHLTIARLRAPANSQSLAAMHQEMGFERAAFNVNELLVMRSELGPGGSRYTEISRHVF
jgi:2''-5'' RNA ligase